MSEGSIAQLLKMSLDKALDTRDAMRERRQAAIEAETKKAEDARKAAAGEAVAEEKSKPKKPKGPSKPKKDNSPERLVQMITTALNQSIKEDVTDAVKAQLDNPASTFNTRLYKMDTKLNYLGVGIDDTLQDTKIIRKQLTKLEKSISRISMGGVGGGGIGDFLDFGKNKAGKAGILGAIGAFFKKFGPAAGGLFMLQHNAASVKQEYDRVKAGLPGEDNDKLLKAFKDEFGDPAGFDRPFNPSHSKERERDFSGKAESEKLRSMDNWLDGDPLTGERKKKSNTFANMLSGMDKFAPSALNVPGPKPRRMLKPKSNTFQNMLNGMDKFMPDPGVDPMPTGSITPPPSPTYAGASIRPLANQTIAASNTNPTLMAQKYHKRMGHIETGMGTYLTSQRDQMPGMNGGRFANGYRPGGGWATPGSYATGDSGARTGGTYGPGDGRNGPSAEIAKQEAQRKATISRLFNGKSMGAGPGGPMGKFSGAAGKFTQVKAKNVGVGKDANRSPRDQAIDAMMKEGATRKFAMAIAGNMAIESGFRPTIENKGDQRDGSSSIGLMQWDPQRLANMRKFAASRGLDSNSIEAQARFAIEEGKAGSPYADFGSVKARQISDANPDMDVGELSTVFMRNAERPSDAAIAHSGPLRAAEAAKANKEYKEAGMTPERATSLMQSLDTKKTTSTFKPVNPSAPLDAGKATVMGGNSDVLAQEGISRGKANLFSGGRKEGEVGANLVEIKSPSGFKFNVHKEAAPAFQGFVNDLEATGYKIYQKNGGGFNPRKKGSGGSWSEHAFGNAIDINPDDNPFTAELKTDLPANVSDMAAKWGITWGGDWKSKKDAMHFEWSGIPFEKIKKAQEDALAKANGPKQKDDSANILIKKGPVKAQKFTVNTDGKLVPIDEDKPNPTRNMRKGKTGLENNPMFRSMKPKIPQRPEDIERERDLPKTAPEADSLKPKPVDKQTEDRQERYQEAERRRLDDRAARATPNQPRPSSYQHQIMAASLAASNRQSRGQNPAAAKPNSIAGTKNVRSDWDRD